MKGIRLIWILALVFCLLIELNSGEGQGQDQGQDQGKGQAPSRRKAGKPRAKLRASPGLKFQSLPQAQTRRPLVGTGGPAPGGPNDIFACNGRSIFNFSISFSPLSYKSMPEIIAYYGFPVEVHSVTSKDGYILELHRIPRGKRSTKSPDNFPVDQAPNSTRPAVILFHGMTGQSTSWVFLGEDSLAFLLANAGYDVWTANARGNKYSNRHTRMNRNQRRYWNWSFDEMATYDVPAIIDYILAKTGEPRLYWVGHSMGGSLFFMTMARYPEYNAKIRSFYGLAPAGYLIQLKIPLLLLAPLAPILDVINSIFGWGEVLPSILTPLVNALGPIVCSPTPVSATFCAFWVYFIAGDNPCQINATQQIGMMAGTGLSNISLRCLYHYIQLVYTETFRTYDHGYAENIRRYGQGKPLNYDLSKVTAPVAVFWGDNDWLVTPQGTARTVRELHNVIGSIRMPDPKWSHMDFISGIDARAFIYEPIMKMMAKYY